MPPKVWGQYVFDVLNHVYAHKLHVFNQKYSHKYFEIVLQFYIYYIVQYKRLSILKCNLLLIIPTYWFGAQETFLLIINVKNRCSA